MLTLPDGRLKIAFEHAHGYAADVTIRAGKSAPLPPAPLRSERAFDFSKVLYEIAGGGSITVTRESLVHAVGGSVTVDVPPGASDVTVTDVDSGERLTLRQSARGGSAALPSGGADPTLSARIRVTGTLKDGLAAAASGLSWTRTIDEPRATILLPPGFDVQAVSVPATVTASRTDAS